MSEYDLVGAARPSIFGLGIGGDADRKLKEVIDRVVDVFGEAITVTGYNLDFEGYRLLKAHGPSVHLLLGGSMVADQMKSEPIQDKRIVDRCIAFVVDAALRLERRGGPGEQASRLPDEF